MTKISRYTVISVPTIDDILIGTDIEQSNETKNFSIQSIVDLTPEKTYAGQSPTTVTVQNIPAGTDILGYTYDTLFQNIYTPFLVPTLELFTPNKIESGTTIPDTRKFQVSYTNIDNVLANSVSFYDENALAIIAEDLTVTDTYDINIGTISLIGDGLTQSWRATALDTNNNRVDSNIVTLTAYYKQFYGNVLVFPTNSAGVRNLQYYTFSTTNVITETITSTKFSIAIPTTKSIVSVITANNENITANFVEDTLDVADAGGNLSEYKIYNLETIIALDIQVTITLQ